MGKLKDCYEKQLRRKVMEAARDYYNCAAASKTAFKPGDKISYGGRVYDFDELKNLLEAALDFWLTGGKYERCFEQELARYLGLKHCSLTNSGSSANLIAFMALTSQKLGERRIKRGDEVITTAVCFPTTLAPIVQYGAVPVLADITIPQYNIDCSQLEMALSSKTKAVMLAHTLGNPFDVEEVRGFCRKHSLWLIEDNCDALGASCFIDGKWSHTGTFGDIGTSSFYASHHITMGEGGAVYTHDTRLKRIIESFRDWGRDCWCSSGHDNTCTNRFSQQFGELPYGYDHKYVFSEFGYNLKVTDLQAAIGCAQLKKLADFIEARRNNWNFLKNALEDLQDVLILPEAAQQTKPSWFGFAITIRKESGISRERIINYLEQKGIQTRMLFSGNIIKHPCFDEMRRTGEGYRVAGELKNSDETMDNTFWVGVYSGITGGMREYMAETIRAAVKNGGSL